MNRAVSILTSDSKQYIENSVDFTFFKIMINKVIDRVCIVCNEITRMLILLSASVSLPSTVSQNICLIY